MSGIFINNDASGWFESGMVKDVTISKNRFYHCGEPIISIHPENTVNGNTAVHSNIKVRGNYFWLHSARLLEAKSTSHIKITGNTVYNAASIDSVLKFVDCSDVSVSGNILRQKNQNIIARSYQLRAMMSNDSYISRIIVVASKLY
ncbi:right-handed parallel beta-helix repeat-containing protein [Chitinophaga pinensis]|uniref:Right handed beta helix domain-containing protein n=1 Tax=Chitinophaga pinensis TaxID=79329 RepID=A0A5C6LHP3_9BACT|nr:right-handed parallel beta-helix repeat-containing protein [Chitinophaga pinensis]TWV88733.1 hypothetical protein FEF09_30315 [Chitinophaga pinensis]